MSNLLKQMSLNNSQGEMEKTSGKTYEKLQTVKANPMIELQKKLHSLTFFLPHSITHSFTHLITFAFTHILALALALTFFLNFSPY